MRSSNIYPGNWVRAKMGAQPIWMSFYCSGFALPERGTNSHHAHNGAFHRTLPDIPLPSKCLTGPTRKKKPRHSERPFWQVNVPPDLSPTRRTAAVCGQVLRSSRSDMKDDGNLNHFICPPASSLDSEVGEPQMYHHSDMVPVKHVETRKTNDAI